MKAVLTLSLCLVCIFASSQVVRTPLGSVYTSLTTYSSQFKDAFSFRSNAASLASIKNFSAGVYSERRFMLQELSSYSFAAAFPTASGNFGIGGDYFGSTAYNETAAEFAYAKKLGQKVDIGLGFNYFSLQASGYGATSSITFNAGTVLHLTDAVQAGVHVYNPLGMKIGKTGEEKLPSIYSVGLGYDASEQLFIGAEIIKAEDEPLSVNAGLQYKFADNLIARGGISSATSVYYIGFGIQLKNLRLDATASFHPYLGVTPGLLFIYNPSK